MGYLAQQSPLIYVCNAPRALRQPTRASTSHVARSLEAAAAAHPRRRRSREGSGVVEMKHEESSPNRAALLLPIVISASLFFSARRWIGEFWGGVVVICWNTPRERIPAAGNLDLEKLRQATYSAQLQMS